MDRRTHNPNVRLVSRHWLNHFPETLEDTFERWEMVLKMCADPVKALQEIGLIVPVLSYAHEEDHLLDALGVDETVMEHEGKLLHEMMFRMKDADSLLRKSTAPQILIWLILRLAPHVLILQALRGWFPVGDKEDDFPPLDRDDDAS